MLGNSRRFMERWTVRLARILEPRLPEEAQQFGPALRLFGTDRFREGQLEIVLSAVRGESLLAVLPTGAGKTLCFQLPAVMQQVHSWSAR
jgi:ATP-dependent DNA helicase RecQ